MGCFDRGVKKWHGMFCPGMFCPAPRFRQSENTSVQLQLVITSKVLNSLDPDHVQTECLA